MPDSLKVMVVDDTATYRLILANVINAIPDVSLACTAANGRLALEKLKESPVDLVLLDIEMPELDGLETLREIKLRYPGTGVVMVSAMNRRSADVTIKALEAGALDFISKPDQGNAQANKDELHRKLVPIMRLLNVKRHSAVVKSVIAERPRVAIQPMVTAPPARDFADMDLSYAPSVPGKMPTKFDAVAIGVSTGGPNALMELIPHLPGDLGVPILLVQHMPPIFTASLATSLGNRSNLRVKEAQSDEPVQANTVYIAPGGKHMVVRLEKEPGKRVAGARIGLNENPPENSCRPSVDVLFRSVASVYGQNVLAVIMTGMGTDGTMGVKSLKRLGCYCLTQSESTCVVYGMPRSVDAMGLSDEQIPLQDLAGRIAKLVKSKR